MIYRVLLSFFLFFTTLSAMENLGFSSGDLCKKSSPPAEYKKVPRYTLQVMSTKTVETAKKILKRLPPQLQKEIKLYKSGCYIASRFSKADKAQTLQKYIAEFKKYGFKDAYIVKTTKWHMINNLISSGVSEKEKPSKPQNTQSNIQKKKPSLILKKKTVSKYMKSEMVLKADKAYKNGDESMALVYYEMLMNSGSTTRQVMNNLCYLYGKRGAWFEAKKIIEREKYTSKLLYAYAYGALEANQDNFIQNLSEYILLDKSGRLALLAASYYEQREDFPRALSYYKIAYKKNPSDIYNIFAYARALDITKKYKEAVLYYKKALQHTNKNQAIYDTIRNRISQLKG